MKKLLPILFLLFALPLWAATIDIDLDNNDAVDVQYGGSNCATLGCVQTWLGIDVLVSDSVYSSSWDGDTTTAPSRNAIYDKIEALVLDAGTLPAGSLGALLRHNGTLWEPVPPGNIGDTIIVGVDSLPAFGVGAASGDIQTIGNALSGDGFTGVGNQAGTADYLRFYDGDSHYTQISAGNSAAHLLMKFPIAYPAGTYWMTMTSAGQMGTYDPSLKQDADATLTALAALSIIQGSLLYGTGADTPAVLAKDSTATRYLSNRGTTNNPKWDKINLPDGVEGKLPIVNLGDATGGDGSKALFDDNTWKVPSGTGDVTSVGDCASGACFDGSSDGGTYLQTYADGNSGLMLLYEASASSTMGAGFMGATGSTQTESYAGQFPVAKPTSANMVLAWGTSPTGTGTFADPYVHAMSFVDLDLYALLTGATFSDNLVIPNANNVTVDAAGEVGIDNTSGQFVYYSTSKRVISPTHFVSIVIPDPAEADDINILKAPYGMTILGIDCIVQGSTSVTGQLQECTSSGGGCADLDADITCDSDGAADDGTLTDPTIASGAWLRWKTTSVSGTPTFLTVTVKYAIVSD